MKTRKLLASALAGSMVLFAGIAPAQAQAQQAEANETAQARPWMDTSLSPDRRAALLLAEMTFDEKIAMLHGPMAMPFGPFTLPEGAIGSAGYIPGNPRLGIPALQETDASLGITNPMLVRGADDMSTPLPSGLALAATFNPEIAYAGGVMIATEARAKGLNVLLAGGMNLARDPRNGRNFEYLGEDPLLAGVLGGESVRGIQSTGMVSTVKHYAVNDQEHNRMTVDSVIGEADMRESDLLAFQIGIERGDPGSVMCAYNMINGVYGCQNDHLLNQVLKGDWGYRGWVMSDWGAVEALEAATNGLEQQSGEQLDQKIWFDQPLREAVANGSIPQSRVDDMALRILRGMFAHGLFDNPPERGAPIDFAAHAAVAQREAEEGIVLLKNEGGILPLAASGARIAVIGGHAEAGVASGGGSSQVTAPYRESSMVPLRSLPIGGEGMMAAWYNVLFHPSPPLAAIRERAGEDKVAFDTGAYPGDAARIAGEADLAIVFVYQPSSEGADAPDMSLPFGQDALIAAVAAAQPNTIVVLQTGNPVEMPWEQDVKGIVESWYSGAKGGEAIARILFGEVNPSGRLPISWPVDASQLPRPEIPGWGTPEGTPTRVDYTIEGSDVGYRWYAREGTQPRYAFGYGLSYTDFDHGAVRVSGGNAPSAAVTVTNSGDRAGQDVVQFYLTGKPGNDSIRRLVGFEKVSLAPGESREVTVRIDPRILAEWDEAAHGWHIAAGDYRIGVGTDAVTITDDAILSLRNRRFGP
ncbi:beta-glucosidase family protein [Sphingosinithalassobacter portus]|uniref:beta-glucosidase family protein n=1 Tax=Stakelama portus TaxID=2676234 RepID=UPI000D6DCE7A|nr:glycoside hydrolase family 3 C-terminal domain-containing protein [Sphingosinithalassobacter portus]